MPEIAGINFFEHPFPSASSCLYSKSVMHATDTGFKPFNFTLKSKTIAMLSKTNHQSESTSLLSLSLSLSLSLFAEK